MGRDEDACYLIRPCVWNLLGQFGHAYSSRLVSSSMMIGVGAEAVDDVTGTGTGGGAAIDGLLHTVYDGSSSRFACSSFKYDKDTAGLETVRTWRKSSWFPYNE